MSGLNGHGPSANGSNGGDPHGSIDERIIRLAERAFHDFDPAASSDDPFGDLARRVTALVREHPDELRYVARAAIDGEPGGLGLFDAFVAIALTRLEALRDEGRLEPGLDVEWAALHIVIFNLSSVLFSDAIENHLPGPLSSDAGLERWHAADTELFRRGFLRSERAASG